jgi:hypothetical protein
MQGFDPDARGPQAGQQIDQRQVQYLLAEIRPQSAAALGDRVLDHRAAPFVAALEQPGLGDSGLEPVAQADFRARRAACRDRTRLADHQHPIARPDHHECSAGRPVRARGALLQILARVGARLAREWLARSAAVVTAFSAGGALVIIRSPVAASTDRLLSATAFTAAPCPEPGVTAHRQILPASSETRGAPARTRSARPPSRRSTRPTRATRPSAPRFSSPRSHRSAG